MNTPIAEKPPLGIMPEHIWRERRVIELLYAIHRYVEAGLPVDPDRVFELQRHVLPEGVLEKK